MEGGGRRDQEIFSRSLGSVQLDRHPEEKPRVTAEGLPKCPALLDLLLANASCVWSLFLSAFFAAVFPVLRILPGTW